MRKANLGARALVFGVVGSITIASIACGGGAASGPGPVAPTGPIGSASTSATASASASVAAPAVKPKVALPEIADAPASCAEFVLPVPPATTGDAKDAGACGSAKDALAAMGVAAAAEAKHDRAARDAALAKIARCERVPLLVSDVIRAESAPIACAESILRGPLEAYGKEALPAHQSAAKGLVAASRLSRLRPKKGDFDLLARGSSDAAALETAIKSVRAWKDVLDQQESEAAALARTAPAEIQAIVSFEIANAWLALVTEIRNTPLPEELKDVKGPKSWKELTVEYQAEIDRVTSAPWEHARLQALVGLGLGVRDGVLLTGLPSFQPLAQSFKSRLGFEQRPTRELDLHAEPANLDAADTGDAIRIAATLPPWAAYAVLERAAPAELLTAKVLNAFAWNRGIPSALRREVERDKKLEAAKKAAISASRLRVAIEYGAKADAEAASGGPHVAPFETLRVAVAKALLGPSASVAPKKAALGKGEPADVAPSKDDKKGDSADEPITPRSGFSLGELDGLAKKAGLLGHLAAFDAALLALEAAQRFGGEAPDAMTTAPDPRKAYEDAIKRLDAVAKSKDKTAIHASRAKELADSARESVKLLSTTPKSAKP